MLAEILNFQGAKPCLGVGSFSYLIKHNIHVLKKNTHGSVFDTITRDTFAGIEVDIPDMDSQSKIAEILSNIDEKIEVNVRINENLAA